MRGPRLYKKYFTSNIPPLQGRNLQAHSGVGHSNHSLGMLCLGLGIVGRCSGLYSKDSDTLGAGDSRLRTDLRFEGSILQQLSNSRHLPLTFFGARFQTPPLLHPRQEANLIWRNLRRPSWTRPARHLRYQPAAPNVLPTILTIISITRHYTFHPSLGFCSIFAGLPASGFFSLQLC